MATILVRGEWRALAEITTDDEGETTFTCSCGVTDTDRGHFQDTVQAAEVHVDHRCPLRRPAVSED